MILIRTNLIFTTHDVEPKKICFIIAMLLRCGCITFRDFHATSIYSHIQEELDSMPAL